MKPTSRHARPTPRTARTQRSPLFIAVIAAVVAVILAVLAEMRMQALLVDGQPYNPTVWSYGRLLVAALLLFCVGFLIGNWINRGGVRRGIHALLADDYRLLKRTLWTIVWCIVAGGVGWLLGLSAAWIQDNNGDWRYSFTLATIAVAIGLFIRCWRGIHADASWGFLITGLAVGLIFTMLVPIQPRSSWDGVTHFDTINALSYGEGAEYDGGDILSLGDPYITEGLVATPEGVRLWADTSFEATQITEDAIAEAQRTGKIEQFEGTSRHNRLSWVKWNSIGYIPAAFGMGTARLIGLNDVGELRFARLFNMLAYVLVWFFGLRFLKSSKLLFALMALIPVALYMAASFSYDPWLIAFTGYAFCRYIGEWQRPDEALTLSGGAAILIPFTLGCLVKAIYFPLAFTFLFFPRSKFPSRGVARPWVWRTVVCATAAFLLLSFAMPFLFTEPASTYSDMRGGDEVSSSGQVAYILNNPLAYGSALGLTSLEFFGLNSFRDSAALLLYIPPSDYEAALGWIYVVMLLLAALFIRTDRDRPYGGLGLKAANAVGIISAYILMATSLYVSFTVVGNEVIEGLQPRYLIPLFPALFGIILNCSRFGLRISESVRDKLAPAVWVVTGLYFLAFITLRFVVFFE